MQMKMCFSTKVVYYIYIYIIISGSNPDNIKIPYFAYDPYAFAWKKMTKNILVFFLLYFNYF